MEMNSKLLCWPFCASLGTLLGSPGKGCCTNWLFGIDGGNQKSGISVAFLFYMFWRKDKGRVVFQSKWFVLVWMLCLLFALFVLVSEQKHLVSLIANNSKYTASCLDWRSGVPATLITYSGPQTTYIFYIFQNMFGLWRSHENHPTGFYSRCLDWNVGISLEKQQKCKDKQLSDFWGESRTCWWSFEARCLGLSKSGTGNLQGRAAFRGLVIERSHILCWI